MYDLKIVGGTLVDGSGRNRYAGDLGIKDGRIVDIGKCDGPAAETLDADGAIVAPGFVDIGGGKASPSTWTSSTGCRTRSTSSHTSHTTRCGST
jgi:N-acyl-D-aspartate/D-glutamate deacylase